MKIEKIKSFSILELWKSTGFGSVMLICTTLLEGFFAFKLFNSTGTHTFGLANYYVSVVYSILIFGTIVFFALRNNRLMVWAAVIFEFSMNTFLSIIAIYLHKNHVPDWQFVLVSQEIIGAILPLATKAFADEVSKKKIYRKRVPVKPEKKSVKRKLKK
jgi:hypothetical protein